MSYEDEKRNVIEQLGQGNWVHIDSDEDDIHFGNAYAIFDNHEIRLRFTRDRGVEMVDVGLSSIEGQFENRLYPLEVVLASINEKYKGELLEYYKRLSMADPSSDEWDKIHEAEACPTSLLVDNWEHVKSVLIGNNVAILEATLTEIQNSFKQMLDQIQPELEAKDTSSPNHFTPY